MSLPLQASGRTWRDAGGHTDPSVQVVHDAIALAIDADAALVRQIVIDALATDPEGFVDALATTVAILAEEADEHGADIRTTLRETALGIHLAAMAEGSGPDHLGPDQSHPDHPEA